MRIDDQDLVGIFAVLLIVCFIGYGVGCDEKKHQAAKIIIEGCEDEKRD